MGCGYRWIEGLYEQIWRIEGRYCDEGLVLLPFFFLWSSVIISMEVKMKEAEGLEF